MYCSNSIKLFLYFIIFMTIVFINQKLRNKLNDTRLLLTTISISVFLVVLLNIFCKKNNESFINIYNDNISNENQYSMGPFSDLILKPKGNSNWRKDPSNLPLYNPYSLYTPQGTPLPLKPEITNLSFKSNGPTVDGTNKTPNNMFMFAYNQCRPECCPSTFSCDHGCVCTTEQQRKFINSRGITNKV